MAHSMLDKDRVDISGSLSPKETICMKQQTLGLTFHSFNIFCLLSERISTVKGKNWLPTGAMGDLDQMVQNAASSDQGFKCLPSF